MKRLLITGSSEPFEGAVQIGGAKNSALKVLVACALAEDRVVLDNIPLKLRDVQITLEMLKGLGAEVSEQPSSRVEIGWPRGPGDCVPDSHGSVRTSLLFLGALLGRIGSASTPRPGGCRIGPRPYDLHIAALEALGARIRDEGLRIRAKTDGLHGAEIHFPMRSTGATENAILAAVRAQGRTTLRNAHTRPEVLDLIGFLNQIGGRARMLGSGLITVDGVERLAGGHYSIIYDNMEAFTFLVAAAISGGSIAIRHFPAHDLEVPMIYLRDAGVRFDRQGDSMVVTRPGVLAPFDLSTGTYPGLNSDMQPLLVALATQADGTSRITDIRFADRFQYVEHLCSLGANIRVLGNVVEVEGPTRLRGASVTATDLRGGAALVVAASIADGTTSMTGFEEVERGYERLAEKLASLGLTIEHSEEE